MPIAFVTGGSGFLGRNLIEALIADGVEVRALARSDAAAEAVTALGASAARGDLLDQAALAQGLDGADVCYHCGAYAKDFGPRDQMWAVNVDGTDAVMRAAEQTGVDSVVHVSTEAVLVGKDTAPLHQADETWPLPKQPIGLYPLTKGAAEERVLAAAERGLRVCIVRPRLIWGRGDTSLLPEFLAVIDKGQYAWIGGGRYPTSTCHVRNVVEGMRLAAEKGQPGQRYFLTDGDPQDFRTFVTRLVESQGRSPGDKTIPRGAARALAAVCDRLWSTLPLPGRPPLTRTAVRLMGEEVTVSDRKARDELGYAAKVSVDEGLAELDAAD